MSLTIELTPEEQARLDQAARREGLEPEAYAHSVLTKTLAQPGVRPSRLSPEEAIRTLDAIAERNRDAPVLPPEALERESLYEGVPEWPIS
jgi:hypothetical protein